MYTYVEYEFAAPDPVGLRMYYILANCGALAAKIASRVAPLLPLAALAMQALRSQLSGPRALCLVLATAARLSGCQEPTAAVLHPGTQQYTVIFNGSTDDACPDQGDGPDDSDVPVRAFRASAASSEVTWLMGTAPRFYLSRSRTIWERPVRQCARAALSSNPDFRHSSPERYDDLLWLQVVWVPASGPIVGLVHNEFRGEQQANRSFCESGQLAQCFYANTLAAASSDGGSTFALQPLPHRRLAFSTPRRYLADSTRQGMAQSLGVLGTPQADGYLYSLVYGELGDPALGEAGRRPGTCLFRTADIQDPTAWRGWDGVAFSVHAVNPYADPPLSNLSAAICRPVLSPAFRFGWTFNTVMRKYLTVGYDDFKFANGSSIPAVVYAVSSDMFIWSEPRFLMTQNVMGPTNGSSTVFTGECMYPSFLGPDSRGQNFEFTGRHFWLFCSVDTGFEQRNVLRWGVNATETGLVAAATAARGHSQIQMQV